jgi:flagellar motor switch protein FliG
MSTSSTAAGRAGADLDEPAGAILATGLDPPGGAARAAGITPIRKAAIVLVSLEQSLASQLLAHLDRSSVEAVTWEIARLERIDPAEQAAVLDEFLGLGIRRLCFVFEDLLRMHDEDIRRAYHHEDNPVWALALAGAAPPVRAKVLGALDANSASVLRQFLEALGPFRLSDAEAAQAEVAERFRRLHDLGEVSLPEPSGSDEVLV